MYVFISLFFSLFYILVVVMIPVSHCHKGMVFAVNCGPTGSPNSFDNFKQFALALGARDVSFATATVCNLYRIVYHKTEGFASSGIAMLFFFTWAHAGMGFLVLYLAFIVYLLPCTSVFQMFWLVAITSIIVHPIAPSPCPTLCIID